MVVLEIGSLYEKFRYNTICNSTQHQEPQELYRDSIAPVSSSASLLNYMITPIAVKSYNEYLQEVVFRLVIIWH